MRLGEDGQECRAFEPRFLIDDGVNVVLRNGVVTVEQDHPTAGNSFLHRSIFVGVAIEIVFVPIYSELELIPKSVHQLLVGTIGGAIIRNDYLVNPLVVFDLRDRFTKHLKPIVMGEAERYHF